MRQGDSDRGAVAVTCDSVVQQGLCGCEWFADSGTIEKKHCYYFHLQTDSRTVGQSDSQTVGQSDSQTVRQSGGTDGTDWPLRVRLG